MKIEDKIKVMRAFSKGRLVQFRRIGGPPSRWVGTTNPVWNFSASEYRVKPNEPVTGYVTVLGYSLGTIIHESPKDAMRSFGATGYIEIKILSDDEDDS